MHAVYWKENSRLQLNQNEEQNDKYNNEQNNNNKCFLAAARSDFVNTRNHTLAADQIRIIDVYVCVSSPTYIKSYIPEYVY